MRKRHAKPYDMFQKTERRRKLVLLVREHPDWTHAELAKHLDCDKTTIAKDLNEITLDMQKMNAESFQVHWQRLLLEMQANKLMCLDMIRATSKITKDGKTVMTGKGSRWMEEFTKIQSLEMKLLGMDKFDPNLGKESRPFDKAQQDAALDAAVKGLEVGLKAGIDTSRMLINKDNVCKSSPPDPAPPADPIRSDSIGDSFEPINKEAI